MSDIRTQVLDQELGVTLVEMCRPPHNYFDAALIRAIADTYDSLAADKRTRVIVLASEGRHFCAGADFRGGHTIGESTRELYREAARLMEAPLPVVAAVQGAAVGGGLGLAMTADFRVATPKTRFIARFTMLGLHHGFGLSVTLPPVLGQQAAKGMLYTGKELAGDQALAAGLCDHLAEDLEGLRPAALDLAREIARAAPLAVRAVRQTLRRAEVQHFREATDREIAAQETLSVTADAIEAREAARADREPMFRGE